MTPFQSLTGNLPDISSLRIFGSHIYAKKPGQHPAKLDHHTANSIFIGYTVTTENVYYINNMTNIVKLGTYAFFDEVHITVESKHAPIAAQALQHLGYANFDNEFVRVHLYWIQH